MRSFYAPIIFISSIICLTVLPRAQGDAVDTWHWRNPVPTGNNLNGVAFGQGSFVAVDDFGKIHTSANGLAWNTESSPVPASLNAISYGSGKFVAVGSSGVIIILENGVWAAHASGTTQTLTSVTYGNGWFVAVGNNGFIARSSDGIAWTPQNSGTAKDQFRVAYGGGVFVAVGHDTNALVSADGATWEPHPITSLGVPFGISGLVYAYGRFSVSIITSAGPFGYSTFTFTATNGISWFLDSTTPRPTATAFGLGVAALVSGGDLAGNPPGTILPAISTSTSGVDWSPQTIPSGAVLRSIAFGNDTFVAVGVNGAVVRSTNGTTWSRNISVEPDFTMTAGAYGGDTYVMVGGQTIVTSRDLVTFNRVDGLVRLLGFMDVTHGNDKFVAVGFRGAIVRSTNGVDWVSSNSGATHNIRSIAYAGGRFVAVGEGGTIRVSQDGVLWSGIFSGTESHLLDVVYGQNRFVTVGDSGTVLTSPDGLSWTPQLSDDTNVLWSVTFGNGQFISVGLNGTVLKSHDGSTWTKPNSGITADLRTVRFGGGLFVAAGGGGGTVPYPGLFSSADGEHWVQRDYGTSKGLAGVSFLNNTFVSFGPGGLILQSDPLGAIYLNAEANPNAGEHEIIISGGEMGRAYRLQACNDLRVGSWADTASFTQTQYITRITIPEVPFSGPTFYRTIAP